MLYLSIANKITCGVSPLFFDHCPEELHVIKQKCYKRRINFAATVRDFGLSAALVTKID
jgi:hypothetical protein